MDFVGRADPVRRMKAWLNGEDARSPLSIVSISGPGGIGKTFLLEHAIRSSNLDARKYLRLRLTGGPESRTLGQLVCYDLLQSCSQLDVSGSRYWIETRRNFEALRSMDDQARAELLKGANDPELRETIEAVFRLGAGIQAAIPALREYVDLTRVDKQQLNAALDLLEKARAYGPEARLLGGLLPDLQGRGRRNRLRAGLESALADGFVGDLAAILTGYRSEDRGKPATSKVPGLDRLLLVIDDFESIADRLNPFLIDHLVPLLSRSKFETLLVVLGRDRLSDTHTGWRQQHESSLRGELRLAPFSREEGEQFVRESGVVDEAAISRLLDETAGYPFLLAGEVQAELDGGRTALSLKGFYDRTTKWMNATQRGWLMPLCFLDVVNEETIGVMLPEENASRVLDWFKAESSVRSPVATNWEVLPIIRSRICAYQKLDSPKRFHELEQLGTAAKHGSIS